MTGNGNEDASQNANKDDKGLASSEASEAAVSANSDAGISANSETPVSDTSIDSNAGPKVDSASPTSEFDRDTKPSGTVYQRPANLSFELTRVFKLIIRSIYCSLSPGIVAIVAVTLLVNALVWRLLDLVLGVELSGVQFGQRFVSTGTSLDQWIFPTVYQGSSWWTDSVVGQVYTEFMTPWKTLAGSHGVQFWSCLLGSILTLAIWSLAGTLVCRLISLRINQKTAKLKDACKFAMGSFVDALGSVMIPLVAVVVMGLPLMIAGLFLASDWLAPVGTILALLFGVLSIPMAIVVVGLCLSWPLMFPAIAMEGRDCFESISRGYAYVFQRPFHFLALIVAVTATGLGLAWLFDFLGQTGIGCLHWAVGVGSNLGDSQRLTELLNPVSEGEEAASFIARWFNAPLLQFWMGLIGLLVRSAKYATFWGLAVAVYVLLRHYLDQAPLDSVYLEGDRKLNDLTATPEAAKS